MDNESGILIECSSDGAIIDLIIAAPPLDSVFSSGTMLTDVVDTFDRQKATSFIMQINDKQVSEIWSLNVVIDSRINTYLFAGFKLKNSLVIVCAGTREKINHLLIDFVAHNCSLSQSNVHKVHKLMHNNQKDSFHDESLFDKIGKLNNELTNMYRQIESQKEALSVLNRQKNEFLGMAAHDLYNPLNVILSYSGFLDEELNGVLSQEHVHLLSRIRAKARYMVKIIDNFLDISKIEAGRIHLDKQRESIGDIIAEAIETNSLAARQKEMQIELKQDEGIPEAFIDKDKVLQVFENLISNGIKYSVSGDTIEVEVKALPEEIIVTVTDHGPGMPEEQLVRIFQIYERGESSSRATGSGFGLAIARKIVREHNGELTVESSRGKGSTFRVNIPIE